MYTITVVRHAKQQSHRKVDPPIIESPAPLGVPYELIITSPYRRCRETALALNHRKTEIQVDVRISEYQGHKTPKPFVLDPNSMLFGPVPGFNESWEECRARLDAHWDYIVAQKKDILICTHGVVVNYLYEKITGTKFYKRGRDVPFGQGFTVKILKKSRLNMNLD